MRTDEELARDLAAGDDGAFEPLYRRWRAPLFAFAARMLGAAEPGRDVVQETFVALWERRREAADLRCVRAWLFVTARNRCLSALRLREAHSRIEAALPPTGPLPPEEADEDVRRVREALMQMSPEHREMLVLREYQEFSYREIAGITGTTESAVKARLFRARQALARRLRPALAPGDES